MVARDIGQEADQALEQILGYLNFSSGSHDPSFHANLNLVFSSFSNSVPDSSNSPLWRSVVEILTEKLADLSQNSPTFRDSGQAKQVIDLVANATLPTFWKFHRDLLFHQQECDIVSPFFLGRVCEAVLQEATDWNDPNQVVEASIRRLNDFIGYRPIATLENQKIEPYAHEWIRPVPLFIRGAGVAHGRYQQVVQLALKLISQTDSAILQSAFFDPDLLDELAFDPRAYDFDHPVNRRPNYHFGQWDPHQLDNQGRYRRFVIQQVTLDALMSRLDQESHLPHKELEFEAAAVLAGTILMAAGISGGGPDSHDSEQTLGKLLPEIAAFRDAFYEKLIHFADEEHQQRLIQEAIDLHQPFAGARQHINAELAKQRASQLEHIHLATLFARMGFATAAHRHVDIVPAVSGRMLCRIDCLYASVQNKLESGKLANAFEDVQAANALIQRSIQCGALIDPWNILGFDGHFSIFPAMENTIHDYRVDDLLDLVQRLFNLYSRLWSEAAAMNQQTLCESIDVAFHTAATWWHQYAAHELTAFDCENALETYEASKRVAGALNIWHNSDSSSAGSIAFWAPHAEMFDSPQAYALVINTLLEQNNYETSMSLLIHWVSQHERIPFEHGRISFYEYVRRWMLGWLNYEPNPESSDSKQQTKWYLFKKFFDYIEANAGEYWDSPTFSQSFSDNFSKASEAPEQDNFSEPLDDEEPEDLFQAAYEDVVYHDSTDDGVDGEVFDSGSSETDQFSSDALNLSRHTGFLLGLSQMWQTLVLYPEIINFNELAEENNDIATTLTGWADRAEQNERLLHHLLEDIQARRISQPFGDQDSMAEYDRQRLAKESLLEQVISAIVETACARRFLQAAIAPATTTSTFSSGIPDYFEDEATIIPALSALVRRNSGDFRKHWQALHKTLQQSPLLYVPLAKGGDPKNIVSARVQQRMVYDLLAFLPRMGLLYETFELLDAARRIEKSNPVGAGGITEFDELFAVGFSAVIHSIVMSDNAPERGDALKVMETEESEEALVDCLESVTETLLETWLEHSKTLRLSVLEQVADEKSWSEFVQFIKRYGKELFTQRFLNLPNVRAILHQGAHVWLRQLQDYGGDQVNLKLLDELESTISMREAAKNLTLVLEAIIENFAEYRDYNNTTTQSDHGDLLYTLLDFLRLQNRYERICWKLKPVILAHRILVRSGKSQAAKRWRRALSKRVGAEAKQYLDELAELQKEYAMQMPTVADRLAERFVKPLAIDRICALVKPAIEEAGQDGPYPIFELLEHETDSLSREPTGVGLDLPAWLVALEDEVETAIEHRFIGRELPTCDYDIHKFIPYEPMSLQEAQIQVENWSKRSTFSDD